MSDLEKAKEEYHQAHSVWFNTSIFAKEKDEVDSNLKKAREALDEAYKKQFPNHEIINF